MNGVKWDVHAMARPPPVSFSLLSVTGCIVHPFIWTARLAILCESCNLLPVVFVIISYLAPPTSLMLGKKQVLWLLSLNRCLRRSQRYCNIRTPPTIPRLFSLFAPLSRLLIHRHSCSCMPLTAAIVECGLSGTVEPTWSGGAPVE